MTVSSFQNGSYLNNGFSTSTTTPIGTNVYSSFYNTDYLEKKYEYNDAREGYEIGYAGRDAVIDTKIANLCTYIEAGKEDKAMKAYQELLAELSGQDRYSQVSENNDQLKAMARQMIEAQIGGSLEDFIKANTANSFQRGFEINWEGDEYQEEDLLKEMCDLDETGRFDGLEKAGGKACKVGLGTAGGAATGAAIGAIFGGIGAVPGAVIGGIVGFIGGLFA